LRSIECLGIPGSGKSTLNAGLLLRIKLAGVEALSFDEAIANAMRKGVGDRWTDPLMKLVPTATSVRFSDRVFFRSSASFGALAAFMGHHPQAMSAILDAQERRSEYEYRPDLVLGWFLHMASRYEVIRSSINGSAVVVMDEVQSTSGLSLRSPIRCRGSC